MASAKNVQQWAEIDGSLQEQEQEHMKLVGRVGFGVFLEEFGFEIHLLDPEHHLAQAMKEQAEHLAVQTADCSEEPLAELLEPRSKHFLTCKFLPMESCENAIKIKGKKAYRLS